MNQMWDQKHSVQLTLILQIGVFFKPIIIFIGVGSKKINAPIKIDYIKGLKPTVKEQKDKKIIYTWKKKSSPSFKKNTQSFKESV